MPFDWRDCPVLVTGARGFLGSNLALRLAQLGAVVYGTTRVPVEAYASIRWMHVDLLDAAAIRSALSATRPAVIFHLAGQTNASHDRDLVIPSLQNNLVSTVLLLLEATVAGNPRIVVTGSLEEPAGSEFAGTVLSPYGVSKWASVVYAQMFSQLYELPVSIARIYMTYGPRQNPQKLIPYVARSLLVGDIPRVGQPDRTVDWVYVDDVVDGLLAAGALHETAGRIIEFGSGELVAIRDLVRIIEEIVGRPGATAFAPAGRPVGVASRRAAVQDAARILNWRARTPLRAGLEKTVAWYRDEFAAANAGAS